MLGHTMGVRFDDTKELARFVRQFQPTRGLPQAQRLLRCSPRSGFGGTPAVAPGPHLPKARSGLVPAWSAGFP